MSVFGVKVMRYPVNHSLNGLSSLSAVGALPMDPSTAGNEHDSQILRYSNIRYHSITS